MFAGRLISGVKNGPSPAWLQQQLMAIGLRPISALVDVTNLMSYDRCRPLHVYDAAKLTGGFIEARLGREGETLRGARRQDLRGRPGVCVIADGSGAIGLGGVMGGETHQGHRGHHRRLRGERLVRPDPHGPDRPRARHHSDAQYRFARGVDPGFVVPGLELATRLILELCGGEPSEVRVAGQAAAPPAAVAFDHAM